jgi:predicted RNA-binding Zn-ribbon protein involved in translation (DUF1610 family)
MKTHRICKVCGKPVIRETKVKEYPFYCPNCYENRYRIETLNVKENRNNVQEHSDNPDERVQ